jgi:hypothetical protein
VLAAIVCALQPLALAIRLPTVCLCGRALRSRLDADGLRRQRLGRRGSPVARHRRGARLRRPGTSPPPSRPSRRSREGRPYAGGTSRSRIEESVPAAAAKPGESRVSDRAGHGRRLADHRDGPARRRADQPEPEYECSMVGRAHPDCREPSRCVLGADSLRAPRGNVAVGAVVGDRQELGRSR